METLEGDNVLSDMESEEGEVSDEEFILVDDTNTCIKRDDMDQKLRNVLSKVFVNVALECYDEMEKAYYSANFSLICFNCDSHEYVVPVPEKQYPYCEICINDLNVSIKMG
ncbi:561_t:CDS:2 [Funneliformis mosseae]|uniref:561_t:CDS:1 n=1 Tax=Funneliformis mosseae TaxID=27381 RepID=A0A9N9HGN6_FUNMO|nr:561_t:CDS:2 [Funneliformis mosseae]